MSIAFRSTDFSASLARRRAEEIVATDGELLMGFVRRRDHAAFAQIVERHGPLVWMICSQVLRHHQDVEDAFQATFLILAERAQTIRASDSAAAWLFGVAQRTALAARRKRQRRREEALASDPPADEESLRAIDKREMLYVLMQEIESLPNRYQTPLVMRYLEGQSRRAIAQQTDLTVGQVQGRLVRGRRLLRTRFLQRGVSLSLAAGAAAGTATSAEAAVTPALVDLTAETCLNVKNSGEVSGLSPAVLALIREGVKAMWMTSVAKCAAVVSAAVLVGGAVWAAQGNSKVPSAGEGATTQVHLQTEAQGNGGGAAENERAKARGAFLAGRFKYKVPFEIGSTEFKEGGRIEIEEVWGTRPRIEVGGQYIVHGKYVLPHGERGKLYFYETASGEWGKTPTADMDLQTVDLNKETGEFQLVHGMAGPGNFHLYLASPDKYSRMFANVYLDTGDNIRRKMTEPRAESPHVEQSQNAVTQKLNEIQHALEQLKAENAEFKKQLELRRIPPAKASNPSGKILQPGDQIVVTSVFGSEGSEKVMAVDNDGKMDFQDGTKPIDIAGLDDSQAVEKIRSALGQSNAWGVFRIERVNGASGATTQLFPKPASEAQLENALTEKFDELRSSLEKVKAENAEMKKQLELSGIAPTTANTSGKVLRPGDQIVVARIDKKSGTIKTAQIVTVDRHGKITSDSQPGWPSIEVGGMEERQAVDAIRKSLEEAYPKDEFRVEGP